MNSFFNAMRPQVQNALMRIQPVAQQQVNDPYMMQRYQAIYGPQNMGYYHPQLQNSPNMGYYNPQNMPNYRPLVNNTYNPNRTQLPNLPNTGRLVY